MAKTYNDINDIPLGQINDEANRTDHNYRIDGPQGSDPVHSKNQTISITDVISEGPIQGLRHGIASVFLNGDSQAGVPNNNNFGSSESQELISARSEDALVTKRYRSFMDDWVRDAVAGTVTAQINKTSRNYERIEAYDASDAGTDRYFRMHRVESLSIHLTSDVGHYDVSVGSFPDHWVSKSASQASFTEFYDDRPVEYTWKTGYNNNVTAGAPGRVSVNSSGIQEWHPGYYTIEGFTPDFWSGRGQLTAHSVNMKLDLILRVKSISDPDAAGNYQTIVFYDEPSKKSDYTSMPRSGVTFTDLGTVQLRQSVQIDGTMMKAYGKSSFQFRPGTLDQAPMSTVGESGLGVTARTNKAVAKSLKQTVNQHPGQQSPTILVGSDSTGFALSEAQIDAVDYVKITISYPAGLHTFHEEGDFHGAAVRYKFGIAVKRPGEINFTDFRFYTDDLEGGFRIHRARQKDAVTFEETINLAPLRPFTDFKVHIERMDSDSGHGIPSWRPGQEHSHYTSIMTSTLDSVTSIMQHKLTLPYTAYAKVDFSAADYQQLPRRHYLCNGLKIQVPSNYVTREESLDGVAGYNRNVSTGELEDTNQDWDGTFRTELVYTDNPAWIYYDILTNNRYGLGGFLSEQDIDKYALYRIAKYCDEEVDDLTGTGNTEPRYTMNLYLTKAVEAYKVLKDMSTNFLSMIYYLDGKLTLVQDVPTGPSYLFNKSNVVEGRFSYESTGSKTRINQIVVKWNNPQNKYRQESITIEDRDNIVKTGNIVPQECFAYGCTSKGQAIRYARWKLYTALNQQEVVSFETGIQGAYINPGDVIDIQDSDRSAVRYGGRISTSSTTSSINLDSSVTINSGSDYTLSVVTVEPGAYAQKDMTVNGISYNAGDLIEEAFIDRDGDGTYSLCAIVSASSASNAYGTNSASSETLLLTWKDTHKVDTKNISNGPGETSTISLCSALATAPTAEGMWVLNETISGVEVASGGKQYRVIGTSENEKNKYAITAAEYFIDKYDSVDDASYTIPELDPIFPVTTYNDVVPPVRGFAADITFGIERSGVVLQLSWTPPAGATRKVRQEDGSLEDIVVDADYKDYNGVEITHNFFGQTSTMFVGRMENSIQVGPIHDGDYEIAIRVVNYSGDRSRAETKTILIDDNTTQLVQVLKFFEVPAGGLANTTLRLVDDNGTDYVEFAKSNYSIEPSKLESITIINACTAETAYRQEVSTPAVDADRANRLSKSNETDHYIVLDASDSVDRLKVIRRNEDLFDGATFAHYWYDAGTGSAASGSSAITGTISKAAFSDIVTGVGTSFCSELTVNQVLITRTQGASDSLTNKFAAKVAKITSDTQLQLMSAPETSVSAQAAYTSNFAPDLQKDVIIGRVFNTGNGTELESFLALDGQVTAEGISYASGSSIESLQPNELGSDNSACQLNTGLTISKSSGGITFCQMGTIKSEGKNTAESSADGFFLGYDHNLEKYTFGVGDNNQKLLWNGTDLSLTGAVTATSGTVGGWSLTTQGLYAGDLTALEASAVNTGFIAGLGDSEGALVLHNQGSIHSKNFFINSDGSAKFRGSISAATGTFFGGLLPNAVGSDELNAAAVGSDQLATGSIDGQHISQSALLAVYETAAGGSVVETSYAALDGQHEKFRIYAGDTAAASAPFRVTKGGQVVANNLQLYDSNDQLYFDSLTGGFTPSALAQIASALSARVFNFAEIWTGNLDASDNSTFEEITLTESTNVTSKLRIPVNKLSATVSEEYFGLTNNAAFTNLDLSTDAGTAVALSDVNNPDSGAAIGRSLKAGEILRVSLLNVPTGVTLTSVSNATKPDDTSFASTTSVEGPVDSTNIYFKMTAAGTFAATINIPGESAVTFSLAVVAKPDTLQAAKNKIPSSITVKLDRNTASANGTTVNVLANQTYNRVFDTTPTASSYNIKTISADGIGYGFITSSVEIQLGQGAVDTQGYISRETTESSLAAESYYYNSTLSVSGGDADHSPSNRLFETSVPTTSAGFVISGGTATQASQNTAVDTLDLSGNVTGSDGMIITPGTSSGTVVIDGNLTVNGTQTTTNTDSLQIADKCILVAANAANAAAVNGAGLYVDRSEFDNTNPNFAWQTSDSAFVASDKVKAAQFKSTGDGSEGSPAYIFGTRSNTGLYAEDASAGDRVVISTHDGSSYTTTTFDSLGITSGKDIIAPSGGEFKNISSNWVAATDNDSYDFKFNNTSGTILHIDSAKNAVCIGTDATDTGVKLHIATAILANRLVPTLDANDLIIENSDNVGMTLYSSTRGTIAFGDATKSDQGRIEYDHTDNHLRFKIGDYTVADLGVFGSTLQFPNVSSVGAGLRFDDDSALDIYNTHQGILAGEGSGITFSTLDKDGGTDRITRAAIKSGISKAGSGYGFLDFQIDKSSQEEEINRLASSLNLWGDDTVGTRLGFGTVFAAKPESLVHFKNDSSTVNTNTNAIVTIDQDTSASHIGTMSGIEFKVGSGTSYIHAVKAASTSIDLDIRARGTSGPVTSIFVDGSLNNIGIDNTTPKSTLHVQQLGIETGSPVAVTGTSETLIASVSVANFRTGKFMIQMEDISNNNYLVAEMLFVYHSSGQSVNATEYGVVFTGSNKGVSFATTYNTGTGNIELKATCSSSSANRKFTVARFGLSRNT